MQKNKKNLQVKKVNIVYKIIKIVSIILMALIFCFLIRIEFPALFEFFYSKYNIETIKQKIVYLIKRDNNYENIKNYYLKMENKTFDKAIMRIAENVYKNCNEFNISYDLMISLIHNESDFIKYAKSRIEVKKNGQIIRIDSALGYCQIYLKVWQDVIPVDSKIIFDEYYNIYWGAYILNYFLQKNNYDVYKSLVSYNGGSKKTNDSETTINNISFNYINKILNDKNELELYKRKLDINFIKNLYYSKK